MATFIKIATVTVGSGGASSMAFNSIAGTYTDLCLKVSARSNRNDGVGFDNLFITFNGSTSSYSSRLVYGNSSSALSANASTTATTFQYATSSTATSNSFANAEIYLPNYSGSSNKPTLSDSSAESNSTGSNDTINGLTANLWSNTSAITSLNITPGVGTSFGQYTTATLYGISKS